MFSGLATGLDTASIVAQLVELKRAPIYRLQARRAGFQDQLTALATLKEKILAIGNAARDLDTAPELLALQTSTSDDGILTARVGSGAAPGTYTLVVDRLATARKMASQGYDGPESTVGSGTLAWSAGGASGTIDVAAGTTLAGLRDAINAQATGITASIINDGSAAGGSRLVLSAAETGTAGDFTLDLSGLGGAGAPAFTELQAAADASFTVDGLAVTSSSNRPADVISGLVLDLRGTGGPVTLTVERDDAAIAAKVEALVAAYNDLADFASAQLAPEGALQGNSTLRMVRDRIDALFATPQATGDVTMFAQLGITRDRQGRLEWDPEEFSAVLARDFGAVRDFFANADGISGKGVLIGQAVDDMTDIASGLFKISTDSLDSRIRSTDRNIERYEQSIDAYRETLERRFRAMEAMVARLQAQGSYLNGIF
jgi:flagellar hook-associated protein 2